MFSQYFILTIFPIAAWMLLLIDRSMSSRKDEPYIVWSKEYWIDAFYIFVAPIAYILLSSSYTMVGKKFRYK